MSDITSVNTPTSADWRDYLALAKPRVMSLVVFTAVAGLAAAPDAPNPVIAIVIILAIAVGAGASGALNMAYDADIDVIMTRTRNRPVPSGRVSASDAATLGVVLSVFSVMVLGLASNVLAAALLAFTIIFYAVVYTRWLKRRTAQNIVIGGLAGALPPAVAWAAVMGSLHPAALAFVALIFFWTPPHFWALALVARDDYARAGVPMLPVTQGARATRRAIVAYSLVVAPLGLTPLMFGVGGWAYAVCAVFGGIGMIVLALRVAAARSGDVDAEGALVGVSAARGMFGGSILYLFVLFAVVIVESMAGAPPVIPSGLESWG